MIKLCQIGPLSGAISTHIVVNLLHIQDNTASQPIHLFTYVLSVKFERLHCIIAGNCVSRQIDKRCNYTRFNM